MKIVLVPVLLLAGACTAMAQPSYCMQDTVVGTYAVAAQGYLIITAADGSLIPVPVASLGIASIDSTGAITSLAYNSMGGQIASRPMPGAIAVNSDCTASVDWGGGVTGALEIMDEGKEMHSQGLTAGAMGSTVAYGDWKRISRVPNTFIAAQCAPNAITGTYAVHMTGTLMMQVGDAVAPVPTALLGIGSAAFDGSAKATVSASIGGQVMPMEITSAGPITVNPDCTATVVWNHTSQGAPLGQSKHFIVVLDGGNEAWGLATENFKGQPVQSVVWNRMSPIPAKAQ